MNAVNTAAAAELSANATNAAVAIATRVTNEARPFCDENRMLE